MHGLILTVEIVKEYSAIIKIIVFITYFYGTLIL